MLTFTDESFTAAGKNSQWNKTVFISLYEQLARICLFCQPMLFESICLSLYLKIEFVMWDYDVQYKVDKDNMLKDLRPS